MAPVPKWGEPDNLKLQELFEQHQRDPRSGADPQNHKKQYIEGIVAAHWPGRSYKTFRQLYIKKATAFETNRELAGARRDQAPPLAPQAPIPPDKLQEEEQDEDQEQEQEQKEQEKQDQEQEQKQGVEDEAREVFEDLTLDDDDDDDNEMPPKYIPKVLEDGGLYSLVHHYPVLGHKFVDGFYEYIFLQFYVQGQSEDNFRPRVSKSGREFILEMHIPVYFIDPQRMEWMPGVSSPDHNSVTSFRTLAAHVAETQEDERILAGPHGQVVPLPFEVERDIHEWKLIALNTGERDPMHVYAVTLKGVKKLKERSIRGEYIEIISPRQQEHQRRAQQQQQQQWIAQEEQGTQQQQQQQQTFMQRLMSPAPRSTQRTSNVIPR